MAVSDVAAFWSYSHEDDEHDGGAIVKLAESLSDEFALVTGQALTLFVDRTGISWGEEWRRRIDDALSSTTFFVPVITPRYFTRAECRRELLEFSSQAQSLGVSELILPIRYAKVKDLSDQNPDEAVALVARMQYVDWTELRLRGPSSTEYRTAVNALAMRFAEMAEVIADKQLSGELDEINKPEDDELGLIDLFDKINAIFPAWIKAVEDNQVNTVQSEAVFKIYYERIRKAKKSGTASAEFALLQRLASDQIPIAERELKVARIYAAKTIELDPLILSAARIGQDHPSDEALFSDVHTAVIAAQKSYRDSDARIEAGITISAEEWTAKRAHVSRTMRRLAQIYALHGQAVDEANHILDNWVDHLRWLD